MSKFSFKVEVSHCVTHAPVYRADCLQDLREKLQAFADSKAVRSDRPPIGPLTFRYELDDDDDVEVVHCFFTNRHEKQVRFMRLRRAD